jgi:hypothetical protein
LFILGIFYHRPARKDKGRRFVGKVESGTSEVSSHLVTMGGSVEKGSVTVSGEPQTTNARMQEIWLPYRHAPSGASIIRLSDEDGTAKEHVPHHQTP